MKDNHLFSKLCILTLLISFLGMNTMSAQWAEKMINRSLDKVQHQAEKRINKGVEKGIDKSMDKAEDGAKDAVKGKKKDKMEQSGNDSDFLEDAAAEDFEFSSNFVGMFEMEMEFTNKEGTTDGTVNYFFNKNVVCMDMTMDNASAKFIVDHDNNKMTIIDKEKKSAMVMTKQTLKNYKADENAEITREGSTRFISGRKCVKYIAESEDYNSTIWVDESVRFDYTNAMKAFGNQSASTNNTGSEYLKQISGFPIEMETVSKKNKKEKTLIRTVSFEEGKVDMNAFSTEGYHVTDMSAFGQ